MLAGVVGVSLVDDGDVSAEAQQGVGRGETRDAQAGHGHPRLVPWRRAGRGWQPVETGHVTPTHSA